MKSLTRLGLGIALTVGAFATSAPLTAGTAEARGCGYYAFAGAFQDYRSAVRRANQVGGRIFNVDRSSSPNAGLGYWAVGRGPAGRGTANRWRRQFQNAGVFDAYIARRCFY